MPATNADGEDQRVIVGFWSAIDLARPLVLLYTIYQFVQRLPEVEHPDRGFVVLGILAVWTSASLFLRRRTRTWLAIELLVGVGGILASALVDSQAAIDGGASTVPGMWPSITVLSWAVLTGPGGGTFAALAVGTADLLLIGTPGELTLHNIVILLLLGSLIGYSSDRIRESNRVTREAAMLAARSAERERLARSVHDGVLQALSYVHRKGLEIGGETAELGRLAAEQEQSLRELIRSPLSEPRLDMGTVDLVPMLTARAGATVDVVDTGESVRMPTDRAREMDAAVGAALDNVAQHAGPDAHAWVLVEQIDGDVVVTVRDNGSGFEKGRLEQARDAGRLGVSSSILGRMEELGGSGSVTSAGRGSRVELRAPIRAPGNERTER